MSSLSVLSLDILTAQLNTFNLLQSVYCMENEFKLDDDSQFIVDLLQDVTSSLDSSSLSSSSIPSHLRFTLCISHTNFTLDLQVSLPLKREEEEKEKGYFPQIHLSCPSWMNRRVYTKLITQLKEKEIKEREERGEEQAEEEGGMLVMAMVDFLREYLPTCVKEMKEKEKVTEEEEETKIARVWYYLPSLSTKEKREDMVEYGKTYNLTGIVVAGKPGVVCVEGSLSSISSYLSFIKNVSWADIPPAHKKITERLREEGDEVVRAFENIKEVTEEVYQGGMRGTRGNRGDMKELKVFLDRYKLGDRLEQVLGANWE